MIVRNFDHKLFAKLADQAGDLRIRPQQIGLYEAGITSPQVVNLLRVANALGLSDKEFLALFPGKQPDKQ